MSRTRGTHAGSLDRAERLSRRVDGSACQETRLLFGVFAAADDFIASNGAVIAEGNRTIGNACGRTKCQRQAVWLDTGRPSRAERIGVILLADYYNKSIGSKWGWSGLVVGTRRGIILVF